jgi:uncharacterized membrane protein (GlpM family)
MQPVIAHFGHWYISGPVYLVPVLALIAYMRVSTWRERRKQGGGRRRGDERGR